MNAKYVNETIKVVENVDVAVTLNSLQGSCRGLIKGLHQRTLEDIQKSLEVSCFTFELLQEIEGCKFSKIIVGCCLRCHQISQWIFI